MTHPSGPIRHPPVAGWGRFAPSTLTAEVTVSEWIDPRYAELVAAWKRSQQPASRDPKEQRPVRGFVTPPKP